MLKKSPSGMAMVRIELGITQQQLADTLGISRSLVAMAERGLRSLPERGRQYLDKLLDIARRMPPNPATTGLRRRTKDRGRPAYNRVKFSTRRNKAGDMLSVTIRDIEPLLSAGELHLTGQNLKNRLLKEGKKHTSPADACRELLGALEHKGETLRTRIDYLEMDISAARIRREDLSASLFLIKAQLKADRKVAREHPSQRKKYRRKIALLYVKKLTLQQQLEKYNRPAMLKRREVITGLQCQLEEQRAIYERIGERLKQMEQGV